MSNNYVLHILRIDWSELDYFGHVNNVSFFKYIQSARVNYWDHIGINSLHAETNIGPILASSSCNFSKPLHYPGNVTIQTTCTHIGNSSFKLNHSLSDDENNLVAKAEDVIVMYDFNQNKKSTIPDHIRELIKVKSVDIKESNQANEIKVVDLGNALEKISEHWSPHVAGSLNGQEVKLAKLKGEFVFHHHEKEDELFLVLDGRLDIVLKDRTIHLEKNQFTIIPRGVEHKPIASEETSVLLFEPATTVNTGNVENDMTKRNLPLI